MGPVLCLVTTGTSTGVLREELVWKEIVVLYWSWY